MKKLAYAFLLLLAVFFTACTAEELDLDNEALLQDELYMDCCMELGQMIAEPYEDED